MYYKETDAGILNIVSNYFLDCFHLQTISSTFEFDELSKKYLDISHDIFNLIQCIIKTKMPISLNSIQANKYGIYLTNVSLNDLIKISNKIKYIKSNDIKELLETDIDDQKKYIPYNIMKLYDKNIDTRKYGKFIDVQAPIGRNDRDNLLILSDLNSVCTDIETSNATGMFTNNELKDLYRITFRIVIPKFLYNYIECDKKISILARYDEQNGSKYIKFRTTKLSKPHAEKSNINNIISNITDNGDINYDLLNDSVLYKVYLSPTIAELEKMIIKFNDLESYYQEQIFGNLYYTLLNTSIGNLLDIPKNISDNIICRLYMREGN